MFAPQVRAAPAPVFTAPVTQQFIPGPQFVGAPRAPVVTQGAWPAPKSSTQQTTPAKQDPANQKPSTSTAPKNA